MRSPLLGHRSRTVLACLLAPALLYVYWPTLAWLGREWLGAGPFAGEARDWSHGPLVLLLIGYMLWCRRRELSSAGASLWGVPLIVAGLGLDFVGDALESPYLAAYSLIPVSLGAVVLFFGTRAGYRLFVPLLLFLIAVPFPAREWGITSSLARVVAMASAFLSGLAGLPVSRHGQHIDVGPDQYVVEPLCSGFNLIMALLALIVPMLYLRGVSAKWLGAALLWVPALGVSTKIVLVSTILLLTPRLGQDTALAVYHGWLGLLFYLASLGFAVLVSTYAHRKAHLRSLPLPRFS